MNNDNMERHCIPIQIDNVKRIRCSDDGRYVFIMTYDKSIIRVNIGWFGDLYNVVEIIKNPDNVVLWIRK